LQVEVGEKAAAIHGYWDGKAERDRQYLSGVTASIAAVDLAMIEQHNASVAAMGALQLRQKVNNERRLWQAATTADWHDAGLNKIEPTRSIWDDMKDAAKDAAQHAAIQAGAGVVVAGACCAITLGFGCPFCGTVVAVAEAAVYAVELAADACNFLWDALAHAEAAFGLTATATPSTDAYIAALKLPDLAKAVQIYGVMSGVQDKAHETDAQLQDALRSAGVAFESARFLRAEVDVDLPSIAAELMFVDEASAATLKAGFDPYVAVVVPDDGDGVKTLHIAIQGTWSVATGIVDAQLTPSSVGANSIPMHGGFAALAKAVFADLDKQGLLTPATLAGVGRVAVTGHSLGGGVAVVLGVLLADYQREQGLSFELRVNTMGQPRVTDYQGGNAVLSSYPDLRFTRVVYDHDPITEVPLQYSHFVPALVLYGDGHVGLRPPAQLNADSGNFLVNGLAKLADNAYCSLANLGRDLFDGRFGEHDFVKNYQANIAALDVKIDQDPKAQKYQQEMHALESVAAKLADIKARMGGLAAVDLATLAASVPMNVSMPAVYKQKLDIAAASADVDDFAAKLHAAIPAGSDAAADQSLADTKAFLAAVALKNNLVLSWYRARMSVANSEGQLQMLRAQNALVEHTLAAQEAHLELLQAGEVLLEARRDALGELALQYLRAEEAAYAAWALVGLDLKDVGLGQGGHVTSAQVTKFKLKWTAQKTAFFAELRSDDDLQMCYPALGVDFTPQSHPAVFAQLHRSGKAVFGIDIAENTTFYRVYMTDVRAYLVPRAGYTLPDVSLYLTKLGSEMIRSKDGRVHSFVTKSSQRHAFQYHDKGHYCAGGATLCGQSSLATPFGQWSLQLDYPRFDALNISGIAKVRVEFSEMHRDSHEAGTPEPYMFKGESVPAWMDKPLSSTTSCPDNPLPPCYECAEKMAKQLGGGGVDNADSTTPPGALQMSMHVIFDRVTALGAWIASRW